LLTYSYVVGISLAIAVPLIAIAMAIGPMANLAKKLIKRSLLELEVLLFLLAIPVGIALIAALAPIVLAAFIVYFVILVILKICKLFWQCTPWYRSREALKLKERSDVEVASRADGHDSQPGDDDDERDGEEEVDVEAYNRGPEAEKHYPSSRGSS
jgi:hypothetical protein